MTTPPSYLWQIPRQGLVYKDDHWHAMADRTLGKAFGLLVPVRAAGDDGWDVAADAGTSFQLHEVKVDEPTRLAAPTGLPPSENYLCLLRYDHPEGRPGSTFNADFLLAKPLKDVAREADLKTQRADQASVADLRMALQNLWRQLGHDLDRYVIGLVRQPQAASVERAAATPPSGAQPLVFAFASCQYPAGMMDRQQANASYQAMARRFPRGSLPTRLLLLGDQVYTDATYGMLDPARLDDRYRAPYEELTARTGPLGQLPQDFQTVLRMTPDDHEIVDDWEPWGKDARGERHERGVAAYWRHQRGETTALPQLRIVEPKPGQPQPDWQLFMADSRTTRDYRNESSIDDATILGPPQTRELERWIRDAPPDNLKIVTSAAMLLPRTRMYMDEPLYLDNWQGYPRSLHGLLALLCDGEVRNIVFLSGDAHLACSARIRVTNKSTGKRAVFESHHAPALYAPFPFANESRWNLLLRDRFCFDHGSDRYECRVAARVAEAGVHGCGLLEAQPTETGWKLKASLLPA